MGGIPQHSNLTVKARSREEGGTAPARRLGGGPDANQTFASSRLRGALLLLLFLAAPRAWAAGIGIPDLGAAALGQAGATVARPGDLTALYYNPGALAWLEGFQIYADLRAIDHRITFQRLDGQGQNPLGWQPVSNSGPVAVAPVLGVSWHTGPLTLALGGHPQTGATGYVYPDPASITGSPARLAPQRYLSIESRSRIYVPVLAAAVQLAPWIGVGAGLQLPVAAFSSRQSVYAGPVAGEYSDFDATIDLAARQWFARSGVFGVSLQPLPWLDAGASLQLQTHFRAAGTIGAQLPPTAQKLGLTVSGNRINVDTVFPWVARAGLRAHLGALAVELAGTFEKWSLLRQIRIQPLDVAVHLGAQEVPLPSLILDKQLRDAGSIRLGGEFALLPWLRLRAGALYETSAIPENRQALDWLHWDRFSVNAGAGVRLGRTDLSFAVARFLQGDRQVRDSALHQLTAFPVQASVIGNGNFHSAITVAALAVSTRL